MTNNEFPAENLPTERIGFLVWTLMDNRGKHFTTAELASLVGLRHNSVWAMMGKLSRVIPIHQTLQGWYIDIE